MLREVDKTKVLDLVQPGDIIAYGGNSLFSRWTKLTTNAQVTHVAMVSLETCDKNHRQIFEATDYDGERTVMSNPLHERINTYDGDMWWLPLSQEARFRYNQQAEQCHTFLSQQIDKDYDIWQLFGAAVDFIDHLPIIGRLSYNKEDTTRWFCSELIAAGLREAQIVELDNVSEVTPIDICRYAIFAPAYYQIKGERTEIAGFNTVDPANSGLSFASR